MPKQCCVENCRLQSDEPGYENLHYFRIPSDKKRNKEWHDSINNHFKTERVFGTYAYVCSFHFEENCFKINTGLDQRVTLKKTAVPTIFSNYGNQASSQNSFFHETSSNTNYTAQIEKSQSTSQETNKGRDFFQASSEKKVEKTHENNLPLSSVSLTANNGTDINQVPNDNKIEKSDENDLPSTSDSFRVNNDLEDKMNSSSSSSLDNASLPSSSMNSQAVLNKANFQIQLLDSSSKKIFQKSIANIDLDAIDLNDKPFVLRLLKNAQKEVEELRKSCKAKNMKLYRSRQRVKNFNSLLSHLKERGLLTEKMSKDLDDAVPQELHAIFARLLETRKRHRKFPCTLRKFATTLHFYSSKAYNYLRKIFFKCLPHPITISKWYRKIECTSGINQASISVLKDKVQKMKQSNGGKPVLCNLVMDEMDIKDKIEIVSDREFGYIDRGNDIDAIPTPAATNVLVTMIVCENGKFKIPVSYYFIVGLTGLEKAKIVNENLIAVHETGVTVTSVTFDGLPANFSMCTALGANMSVNRPDEQVFPHPVTGENVYLIFDGCHALKLMRNVLASGNEMYDSEGHLISWTHIEKLIDFQNEQQLNAGNKLNEEHRRWEDNKMNVRIAAQTFSRSVHDSLMYMRDVLKLQEFANVEGTAKFCSVVDSGFDILNSRHLYSKDEFKEGISKKNFEKIKTKVEEINAYLKSLRFENGELVINSKKKTGFEGMIISLQNVLNIYAKYFEPHDLYFLTYKVSQDHLEVFFSAVRSRGGHNNNPTCYQFCNAFKKLLTHADVEGLSKGNCVTLDDTELLCISENTWKALSNTMVYLIQTDVDVRLGANEIDFEDQTFYGTGTNKKYIDDVVGHIAGAVTRKILLRTKCYSCPLVLTDETSHSALIEKKNRGGLIKPSLDIVRVCQLLEHMFRLEYKSKKGIFKDMCLHMSSMIPDHLLVIQHSQDPSQHRSQLIKTIIMKYFLLRSKKFELLKSRRKKRVRRKLTKLILQCHD